MTPNTPLGRYWSGTHRPLNCLVFVLPFIVVYEIGAQLVGTDLLARYQLGLFLSKLGAPAKILPALLVIVVLLAWHVALRQKARVDAGAVGFMLAEAVFWAVPLLGMGILANRFNVDATSLQATLRPAHSVGQDLLVGVGGGVYEEFLFRLIGLNICTLLLVDVLELGSDLGYAISIGLCSTGFALYHFWGAQAFDWSPFGYYFLAGVYLGGVYVMRGFGLAVGTHVFYNLMVVLLNNLS